MRENTKWIMLITALAFVGLMVFEWGMDLSGRSSMAGFGVEIGKINGEAVTYGELQALERELQQQYQANQAEPITSSQQKEIEAAAWDQLIMERLIQQEIRARRLEATPDEIRQAARFAPPPEFYEHELFQTDGQFDLGKYQQFLGSPAVDDQLLAQLESYYRDLISRNKLYQQILASTYLTDSDLWRLWRDQNDLARVRYLALSPDALVSDDEVSVTDDEVTVFYRQHRKDFVRPASAKIRVAVLPKLPSAADTTAARDHALELRREILDGADFAAVAERESEDQGSAINGGDLGSFSRGQMVPAFESAVWSAPLNTVTEPVQSQYGFHLILVRARSADEATASHILIRIDRGDETEDAILGVADSLEHLALTTTVEGAANELGLSSREAEITAELPIVAGIGRLDEGIDWIFSDEGEVGEISPLFETLENFYIFELLDRRAERALTLEEATPGIRDRLLAAKRHDLAVERAREMLDEARKTSIDDVASANGLMAQATETFSRFDFVPGLGQANPVIGAAFGLEPGKISEVLEANGLLYLVEVIEQTPADRETFENAKDTFREQAASALNQQRWGQYLASLKEQAKIVDNRQKALNAAHHDHDHPHW